MAETKTRPTAVSVDDYLDAVPDEGRRADGRKVRDMMERISGYPATMWGPSIIGFGRYHYRYDSGHEGEMARIGFSPRAKELVLYILGDFPDRRTLLESLGRHREGKACVYIKRLADLDEQVLENLIQASLDYMQRKYPEGG